MKKIVHCPIELELEVIVFAKRDESAPPLFPANKAITLQRQESLSNSNSADPELLTQFFFSRNGQIRLEFTGKDSFSEDLFQLIVQRNWGFF